MMRRDKAMSIIFQRGLGNPFASPRLVGIELNPGPRSKRSNNTKQQKRRRTRRSGGAIASQRPIPMSGSNASVSLPKLVRCVIPRTTCIFPDTYVAWSKTVVESTMNSAASTQNSYHLNSPAFNFGPQAQWTGAYANNYPSGLSYLLGSTAAAGSVAPYAHSTVVEYEWFLDLTNIAAATAVVTVIPSYNNTLTGMTTATLSEQRGAIQLLCPPSMNTPLRMTSRGRISDLIGVTETEIMNDTLTYGQAVGALPSYNFYMHIVASSVDGSTVTSMQTRSTVFLKLKLSTLNPFSSAAPI